MPADWIDLSKLSPAERYHEVEHAIAQLYDYPRRAYVGLPGEFEEKVEKARALKIDPESREIAVDGERYWFGIEDDVYLDQDVYHAYCAEEGEEECEDLEEVVEREVEELFRRADEYNRERKDGCYWATLENDNPDFYVAALIAICPVKE